MSQSTDRRPKKWCHLREAWVEPSYEELVAMHLTLEDILDETRVKVHALLGDVADLTSELNANAAIRRDLERRIETLDDGAVWALQEQIIDLKAELERERTLTAMAQHQLATLQGAYDDLTTVANAAQEAQHLAERRVAKLEDMMRED